MKTASRGELTKVAHQLFDPLITDLTKQVGEAREQIADLHRKSASLLAAISELPTQKDIADTQKRVRNEDAKLEKAIGDVQDSTDARFAHANRVALARDKSFHRELDARTAERREFLQEVQALRVLVGKQRAALVEVRERQGVQHDVQERLLTKFSEMESGK